LQEALDLSFDRLLMMMISMVKTRNLACVCATTEAGDRNICISLSKNILSMKTSFNIKDNIKENYVPYIPVFLLNRPSGS